MTILLLLAELIENDIDVALYEKTTCIWATKKYYGYKKLEEHYSEKLYDDASKKVGTMLAIGYDNGKFYIVKVNWGAEEDRERSRDGEVEMNWYFDEENTKKQMLRTGTRNGKDLIAEIAKRFRMHKGFVYSYITKFCDEKEVKYSYYVHY